MSSAACGVAGHAACRDIHERCDDMFGQQHPIFELLKKDPRYKLEAYQFVRDALAYAQDELGMGQRPESSDADDPPPALVVSPVPALLSLPHAVSVRAAIAVTDSVVPSVLPMLLSFTYPTFD